MIDDNENRHSKNENIDLNENEPKESRSAESKGFYHEKHKHDFHFHPHSKFNTVTPHLHTKDKTENRQNENETHQLNTENDPGESDHETIKKLEQEIANLKDTLLRKLAESDNLRKRLEKEKEDSSKYANTRFAKDLLSVADNFERVTKNLSAVKEKIESDATLKPFFEGVLLCGKELLSVFKKHGINQIEVSEGTPFDPNFHQAMCEIESKEHESGIIINVMQSGYMYNDRLLRPSMVSVAKKTDNNSDSNDEQ